MKPLVDIIPSQKISASAKEVIKSITFNHLCLNSNQIKPNDVFIALKGEYQHGLDYIEKAIDKGAVAVLSDKISDKSCSIPVVFIKDLKAILSTLAQNCYSIKPRDIVAVTGTNGKTSIVDFICQLLGQLNIETLGIGTLGVCDHTGLLAETHHTTPDILTLYRVINKYGNNKVVVLEASSHALVQGRLAGLPISCAIFSNLSQDHLDYHQNMDNYFLAKQQLFLINGLQTAIINKDDEYATRLVDTTTASTILHYGLAQEQYLQYTFFNNLVVNKNGFTGVVGCGKITPIPFCFTLLGRFNLYNLLASITYLQSLKVPLAQIVPLISKIRPIIGRMQQLDKHLIWIDFAHTPDALLEAISAIKTHYPHQKIIVVLGCGGNRDKSKRAKMGKVCDQLANNTILTNDNSRDEAPLDIISQIQSGMSMTQPTIVLDREQAIKTAIGMLNKDTCLLITGKGHETTQTIGQTKQTFNDFLVAKKYVS